MSLARRTFIMSGLATVLTGGAVSAVFIAEGRKEKAQERAVVDKKKLAGLATFDGTPAYFTGEGRETDAQGDFDVIVWHGVKGQLSIMAVAGPWAGVGLTFKSQDATVLVRKVDGAEPVQLLYKLREFSGGHDNSAWPDQRFVYTKDEKKGQKTSTLFRVSGAIARGKAFEITLNVQDKLAINLGTGSFVLNARGQNTYYGRLKSPLQQAQIHSSPAPRI